jgi:hypothetical protein
MRHIVPKTVVFEQVEQMSTFLRKPDRMLLADLIHGFGREMVG